MRILTKIQGIRKIAKRMLKIKNVIAVYLFGSMAKNKSGPLSDIDICIFGELNEKEKNKVLEDSSDNLDISFFNDLPITIKFKVVKEGIPLAVKDKNLINNIKINTARNYLDFKYVINRYCKEVLKCTT